MEYSDIYSKNVSKETYSEMIYQDDLSTDGQPLYHRQDQKQVFMFMVRGGLNLRFYRLAAVGLGMFSVLLLAVDIGLGVKYHTDSEKYIALYQNITQTTNKLEQLRRENSDLNKTTQIDLTTLQEDLQKLNEVGSQLKSAKLNSAELQRQVERLQGQKMKLQSHITEVADSCDHCLPGWKLLNSVCYYFPLSDSIPLRSWKSSRDYCIEQGADLAVIDSNEKQGFINKAIEALRYGSGPWHITGFWIGLKDDEEEDTWKWLDGTELTQGYWAPGEPNDMHNEDCAAIYSKNHPSSTWHPMKTWNDAPCTFPLKWICEMKADH